ncbi:unnamed protein product [Colias eurytheme]|nr:unnamed protein product [Colias eurytheme]
MFRKNLESFNSDLYAITETGCNESIHDGEIVPVGYHIIRCDRLDGRKQGGVLLVAAQRIELRRVEISNISVDSCVFELVCATVHLNHRFLYLCCVVYIPPGSSETDYMTLFKIIEDLSCRYKSIIVLGDFNLHSCPLSVTQYYEYFLAYCKFAQSNKVPNCMNRQLDLVLSSSSRGEVLVVASDEALVPVDVYHPPLVVSVSSSLERVGRYSEHSDCNIKPQWNFYKADYHALYSKLAEVDWSALYATKDVDEIISYFYTVINNIFEECVPRRKHRSATARSYPSWYTNSIIKDLKLKASLHKRYKESKKDSDYQEFSCCRSRIKKSIDTAYKNYLIKIQNQFGHDPKSFLELL